MPSSSSSKSSRGSGSDSGDPVGSRYVRALLNRHDVAPGQHVTTIAEILSVGYTLAYRRMNGAVSWELEEIEAVARHFGESLADVFAEDRESEELPAMLMAGPVRVPCQLAVGNPLRDPPRNSLVALKLGEQWMVVPATDAGASACFEVRSMRVIGTGDRR